MRHHRCHHVPTTDALLRTEDVLAQLRVRWCRAGLSVGLSVEPTTEPPLWLPSCSQGVRKVTAGTPVFPMQLEARNRHNAMHFPKCLNHPPRAPEQGREKPLPGDGSHLSFSESPLKFDFSPMNMCFSMFRIASPFLQADIQAKPAEADPPGGQARSLGRPPPVSPQPAGLVLGHLRATGVRGFAGDRYSVVLLGAACSSLSGGGS